jgi:chlorite dismutase
MSDVRPITRHISYYPILPIEGLHVIHLFYRVERQAWNDVDSEERVKRRRVFTRLVAEIQAHPNTQLLSFSMVTPKADLGFMLVTPDLQFADRCTKRLGEGLGQGILSPVFSWLSLTERSEYTTGEEEYGASLVVEENLEKGSEAYEEKMTAFRDRMAKYLMDRLEPNLPPLNDWPVFCFYPMSKRRNPDQNWYEQSFEERKRLMAGHARIGRTYAGRVRQLITGSTGLDDMEWGVTLFAKSTSEIKSIVYEMRFDEVSNRYAEFGRFFIGIQMKIPNLCNRLNL